jgi:hypothetical protein
MRGAGDWILRLRNFRFKKYESKCSLIVRMVYNNVSKENKKGVGGKAI